MKSYKWGWLLGLGLAISMCMNVWAQDGRNHRDGHHRGQKDKTSYQQGRHDGKRDLTQRVYRITNADSSQKAKMKPAVERASKRLEALRQNYQKQEKRVLDSLSLQVKPYLKEEQLKRLEGWREKTEKR